MHTIGINGLDLCMHAGRRQSSIKYTRKKRDDGPIVAIAKMTTTMTHRRRKRCRCAIEKIRRKTVWAPTQAFSFASCYGSGYHRNSIPRWSEAGKIYDLIKRYWTEGLNDRTDCKLRTERHISMKSPRKRRSTEKAKAFSQEKFLSLLTIDLSPPTR